MQKRLLVTLITIGLIVLFSGCDVSNQPEIASQTMPDTLPFISDQPSSTDTILTNDVPATGNLPSIPPNEDPIGEPALPCLIVYNGYSEFRELHDLLEQDDEFIEEYLSSDERYDSIGLNTRMDIENLFVSLYDLYFPYLESSEAASTALYIGYIENGHAVQMPVYIVFEVNEVNYVFILSASSNWGNRPGPTAEEVIGNWDVELDGQLELLKEESGVGIYFWQRTDDGRVIFIMDIHGVYTLATVHNAEDVQSAIDGLFSFDFRPLHWMIDYEDGTGTGYDSDINEFWINFREAVLHRDYAVIATFVNFPLKTRGPLDWDPIELIELEEFESVFSAYLGGWDSPWYPTNFDYIEQNAYLAHYEQDSARAGNMHLNRINGKWKITFIYMEESD